MALSYRDFGVSPSADFNLEAANAMYDVIMGMSDEEALAFCRVLAFDGITADIEAHKPEIQDFVSKFYTEQAQVIEKRLARTFVSKRAAGDDTDSLIEAVVNIRKAIGDYTTEERRTNVARQTRDASGRFMTMNRKIEYGTRDRQLSGKEAKRLGVPLTMQHEEDQKNFREAYLQVRDFLNKELANLPEDSTLVRFHYEVPDRDARGKLTGSKTPETVTSVGIAGVDDLKPEKFKDGGKLRSVEVKVTSDLSVNGASFNLMNAVAGPQSASYVAGLNGDKVGGDMRSFAEEWHTRGQAGTNAQMYNRLRSGSEFVNALTPDRFTRLKAALNAGSWIGQYGPEAEKVVGPTARKTAYRYRGIETKPNEAVVRFVESAPREQVLNGRKVDAPTKGGGLKQLNEESPIIRYFTARLPKAELYTLQRKSGTIPPSEGIIIDRQGKVTTQAVGYGDDWYLPFNLRNIGKLNGGEYIRTRAIGGLTTEDIYTGLVSGARRVTVVSRSGVFTMEFDESFRGNRRYSDKAHRMVQRYGALLDAVQSEKITPGDVSPARYAEIKAEALAMYGDDLDGVNAEIERQKARERENPRLAASEKEAIKTAVLEEAAAKVQTSNGMPMGVDDFIRDLQTKYVREQLAKYPQLAADQPQMLANGVAARYGDRDAVLATLGLEEEVARRTEQAQRDYAASLKPLKLDGNGYNYAAQALREQFPYYIKANVSWRDTPTLMVNGQPVKQSVNAPDSGYIKPGFNRPAGAAAGYYDRSITGTGKIDADTTNYQNWSVSANRSPRFTDHEERQAARAERSEAKAETKTQAEYKPSLLADADNLVALGKHFQSFTKTKNGEEFSPEVMRKHFPKLSMSESDLRAALADPESGIRAEVAKEVEKAREFFTLDEEIVDAFLNPGKAARKPLEYSTERALLNPNDNFFFEEVIPNGTPEQYQTKFESLPGIKRIMELTSIQGITDPNAETALDKFLAEQRDLFRLDEQHVARRGQIGRPLAPANRQRFDNDVRNATMAKQFIKRYQKAKVDTAVEGKILPPVGSAPDGVQTELAVYGADDNGVLRPYSIEQILDMARKNQG